MPETPEVSEEHGDYKYHVEKGENGVICYRTPLNSLDAPDEQLEYGDLPTKSLREAFVNYANTPADLIHAATSVGLT